MKTSKKSITLPCEEICPKCGSGDINRIHRMPGKLDLDYNYKYLKRSNEFVHIDGWMNAKVIKECIMHHCRICQYDWETATANPK